MRFLTRRWCNLTALAALLTATPAFAEWGLNMPRGVTAVSREIYDLHMTIFWICVVIGVVVFGVMFWSILHHRKSQGAKASQFHESTTVEIIWTVVPFVILVGMAVPATSSLIKIYDSGEADLDIKVTGYQWKWHYDYLGKDVSFFSNLSTPRDEIYNRVPKNENYLLEVDEPVVVPINKKIRFLLTANDVIHAWWVPELATKRDAIPGFINEMWTRIEEPGIYRGQCAELCGKDHGFMPIVVDARPQAEYEAWLLAKQEAARAEAELKDKVWTREELYARGEQVYAKACAACHQINGEGVAPTFPGLKASPYVKGPIEAHVDIVVNGKPGTMMAAFGPQLSEVDIAAVVTYERNAWGNNMGDFIQPLKIVEMKAAK